MMIHHPPVVLSRLQIWQQNTRKSQTAQHYILNTNPASFNIILIQKPWIDSFGNTRGNPHWHIVYPSNCYVDNHDTIHSIILVNTNISTDSYASLHIPHSDITAIHLKGDFRHCSIFNIYNNCTNNSSITALHNYLNTSLDTTLSTPTDHMLWLGNFNRHHPMWEENRNYRLFSPSHLIDPLIDFIVNHNMTLALPLGIPTYETALRNWTRPDIVWCLNNPVDPLSPAMSGLAHGHHVLTTSPSSPNSSTQSHMPTYPPHVTSEWLTLMQSTSNCNQD